VGHSFSKPAWVSSIRDPISKNPSQKWAVGVAGGIGPKFNPQYCKEKKKNYSLDQSGHKNPKNN
jgi:hypothetical protein